MVSKEIQTNPDLQLPIKKRYLKNFYTQQPAPSSSSTGLFMKMKGESATGGLQDGVLFRFQWDGEDSPGSDQAHLKTRPMPCLLHWPEWEKYRKLILSLQLWISSEKQFAKSRSQQGTKFWRMKNIENTLEFWLWYLKDLPVTVKERRHRTTKWTLTIIKYEKFSYLRKFFYTYILILVLIVLIIHILHISKARDDNNFCSLV